MIHESINGDALPTRFDFKQAQQRWYACWERHGYFHTSPELPGEPFTIVIPPPNVTGALHLGHALNNTLQDILIRMRRMQGYNTLWMPGTDHAGIATQAVVERRLREEENKTRHDLGREQLVRRIWAWKDAYEARILSQLKQIGCSCDWQRTRFTLDDVCARAVRQTFFDLFSKQLIYRGQRLVNWDTYLQTAVSDDEVFHEPVTGHFWHIRYPVLQPRPGEPKFVTIATTRPETLLGDTAVAVHPDPATALQRLESQLREKLSVAPAKERDAYQAELDNIAERRRSRLAELELLRDMALAGRRLILPLLEREIPLIVDEWAKPEMGSGCVKITPAHDANDYEVGTRRRLPMINILNPDGTMNSHTGRYQGLTIMDCRDRVVADLAAAGLLAEVEDREIDLAHSDRSKTPIEPYLADQWFVKMDQLAQSAMDAVTDGRVAIFPPRYAKGYLDWLAEKRDWPVSRQLWWGHQIPVWSIEGDEATLARLKLPHLDGVDVRSVEQNVRGEFRDKVCSLVTPTSSEGRWMLLTCVAPGNESLERRLEAAGLVQEPDVLDTWFSSALWPHSTLGWPERTPELARYYPTSVLITSRDIITLWVARMVLTGLNNMGDVPFRHVYIHPKILDGDGDTMSKSKGNGVDPIDVIEKFGADALRFGLAYLTTDTQDVRMPVQFECPHCQALLEQTKKNRLLPRLACPSCGQSFSTQWATKDDDSSLPRGAVVSERFELARNFCNKLWNVSRLILINLDGYTHRKLGDAQIAFEDHWILSRLASVTRDVTTALETYRYADAARTLYDFAWDEFCSFYAEMAKPRFENKQTRGTAQIMIAHVLDNLLRLLHPMTPFLTEEVWSLLGRIAPVRGLDESKSASEHIVIAQWPEPDWRRRNETLERQFSVFQSVLGAIREIRSRQGIAPRKAIEFSVRCDEASAKLLQPMQPFFSSMAWARCTACGPAAEPPATHAQVRLHEIDVYVDLRGLIDVQAERVRLEKQIEKLEKSIADKQTKLGNETFLRKAPPDVVRREQDSLAELRNQLAAARDTLSKLSDG